MVIFSNALFAIYSVYARNASIIARETETVCLNGQNSCWWLIVPNLVTASHGMCVYGVQIDGYR